MRIIKWFFKSKKIGQDQDAPFLCTRCDSYHVPFLSQSKSHVLKSSNENRRLTLPETFNSRPVFIGHQGRSSPNFSSDQELYRELIKRLVKRNDLMLWEGRGSKGIWSRGFSESDKQEGDL